MSFKGRPGRIRGFKYMGFAGRHGFRPVTRQMSKRNYIIKRSSDPSGRVADHLYVRYSNHR